MPETTGGSDILPPTPPKEGGKFGSYSYKQTREALKNSTLPEGNRKLLEARQKSLIDEAAAAGHFDSAAYSINNIIQRSTWGEVSVKIREASPELEQNAHGYEDYKEEWEGMVQDSAEGAAARIQLLGIDRKRNSKPADFEKWLGRHGYTRERVKRLVDTMRQKYIYPLLPDDTVDLVGYELKKQREMSQPPGWISPDEVQKLLRKQQELLSQQQRRSRQDRVSGVEFVIDFEGMGIKGKEDEQRQYVRQLLDAIEKSNRDSHDMANTYVVRGLETALDQMEPSVAREVRARLAIHDCSELIKQANGWIFRETEKVGPGYATGSAATAAEDRGHALTGEVIETFFYSLINPANTDIENNRNYYLPDFDVALAWNYLQELNDKNKYENWVKRVGFNFDSKDSEKKVNFYKDGNPTRKEAVRKHAITTLLRESKRINGGLVNAQKSFQFAEKIAKATLEESVFDRGATAGNDQAGEFFGLMEWREGRKEDGRPRGPMIHERAIKGFGTSWLRKSIEDNNIESMLTAEEIVKNISKIKSDWVYYCTVTLTRYKLLNQLLLDPAPKPDSIGKASLQDAVIYFITADKPKTGNKNGPQKLRTWWAAGIVDMALANVNLGWNSVSLDEFRRTLTQDVLSPEAGTFLTQAHWDWIKKATDYDRRLYQLELARTFKGLEGRK